MRADVITTGCRYASFNFRYGHASSSTVNGVLWAVRRFGEIRPNDWSLATDSTIAVSSRFESHMMSGMAGGTVHGRVVPSTSDDWQRLVADYVADYVESLNGVSLAPDPRLTVVPGSLPCPVYRSDRMVIEFALPDATGIRNRMFWCYHASLTGCSGPEAAMEFAALLLPLVAAHEVNHHMRHVNDLDTGDHFVEEQVAQLVAADWFDTNDQFARSVPMLTAACARALRRLRRLAPLSSAVEAGFRMNALESLADRGVVHWRDVHRAEHAAAIHQGAIEDMLRGDDVARELAEGGVERGRAHDYFDDRYMKSAAEYWHFSMAWLVSYLTHHRHGDFRQSATTYLARRA